MPSLDPPSNSSDINGGGPVSRSVYLTGWLNDNFLDKFPGLRLQLATQRTGTEDKNSIEGGTTINLGKTDSDPSTPTTNDRPPISALEREELAIIKKLHKSAEEFANRLEFSNLTLGPAEGLHPSETLDWAETAPKVAVEGDQEKNTSPQDSNKADSIGSSSLQPAETKASNDDAAATAGTNADTTAVNPLTPDARTVSSDTSLHTTGQNEKVQFELSPTDLQESSAINLSFRYVRILEALKEPAKQEAFVKTLEQRYAEIGRLRPMVSAALRRDLHARFRNHFEEIMKEPNLEKILRLVRE